MEIKVRMYRHGLGDCFLLTFPKGGGEFHMMIDCGVLQNLDGAPERLTKVVEHVVETTKGELDLFVMTHEHWDHISGFCYEGPFTILNDKDRIKIKNVWLSYLENPNDPLADGLDKKKKIQEDAVRAALNYARATGLYQPELGVRDCASDADGSGAAHLAIWQGSDALFNFVGPTREELRAENAASTPLGVDGGGGPVLAANGAQDKFGRKVNTLREARNYIASLDPSPDKYLKPGQVLKLPGVEGVRIYVLGPPSDLKLLHDMEPNDETSDEIIYPNPPAAALAAQRSLSGSFLSALQASGVLGPPHVDNMQPFDEEYRMPASDLEQRPPNLVPGGEDYDADYRFFDRMYFSQGGAPDQEWRRIDEEWLLPAGGLAIDLAGYTNNTSLALAIELVESGKVLLFPGDAQIGNWQSWQAVTWSVEDAQGNKSEVKIEQLLLNTVFYKVGHHGSHNATLSKQGLERMPDGKLVAMIPVNQQQAREQCSKTNPRGWLMPAPVLYKHLLDRTRGRIIRDDNGIPTLEDCEAAHLSPDGYSQFTQHIGKDDSADNLYVEYTISD